MRSWSPWAMWGSLGVIVGCLPVSTFEYGTGTTGSTGPGEGMSATSNVGVTGTGGVTSEGSTGTSSSSSSEAMPTTAAESTMCSFVCEMEDLPPLECEVLAQDCPEGQKCMPIITDGGGAWNSSRCVPVIGTGAPGEPCTAESVAEGLDSCAEGVMCWGVDKEGNGTCIAQCGGTYEAPTCPGDGICTIASEGFLAICFPDCDPLLQDCDEGAACYPINDDHFNCAPDASGDTGKANDPCEFINVCEAGLLCADPALVGKGCAQDLQGCCTPFCEFPGGSCPNGDQECLQWFDPAMLPEGDPKLDIGFCGLPQ